MLWCHEAVPEANVRGSRATPARSHACGESHVIYEANWVFCPIKWWRRGGREEPWLCTHFPHWCCQSSTRL